MKKYIFIALIAASTASALIAFAHADDTKEIPAITKAPERPTTAVEIYIQPPPVQRFRPGKVPDSICQYNKDTLEPIEEIIDMCIASKQNWLRF
tara:strand:- start:1715 stop:1996 length:282 start_codon:yes stop_codon:yes gene_type:complete